MRAHNGSFQQAPSGKVYQLMRLTVEDDTLFSEISANKYMVWIRYSAQDGEHRPHAVTHDVNFKMTLCAL